jgi:non-ribosomal peptide synthetase component F/acyl carrier protein
MNTQLRTPPLQAGVLDEPLSLSLLERLAAHVQLRPAAPAIISGQQQLGYAELDAAANRLAHHLQDLGVARDVPVGICLMPGTELLVAMLAVLKAGGAYLPLDPAWPRERLQQMLGVVQPTVLISCTRLRERCPVGTHTLLDLDQERAGIAAQSAADPAVEIVPEQLCYLMFTSGSSGAPKCVMVTQGNLAGLFPPLCAALDFGPDDVWSWFHSASFGFSVWEVHGALLHGACIQVVPAAIRNVPAALGAWIAEQRVTVFSQTPSALRRLLGVKGFHQAIAGSRLRYLALSGEALRPEDIATWHRFHDSGGHDSGGHDSGRHDSGRHDADPHDAGQRAAAPRLLSTYALTETGGQVTLRLYSAADASTDGVRNIGQPLSGRHVLILDANGRPVGPGEAGELWVAGACVAAGYFGDVSLTAQRFTMHAVAGQGLLRGYRTGDRMRLLADGTLDYLGRADEQLKYRGYRIEPAEIEAALRAHPGVRDAAVALQNDAAGNPRLTAHIVSAEPDAAGLEFWPSLGAYEVYDELLYGLMNAEPVRLAAYRAAFAGSVPGKVVLDIGTGSDAVLARLCIEAGARHVYAVEVLASAARQAAELVRTLGLEDRITVLHGDIATLTLPEPVDVCTQGIVGNIGSADGIVPVWNAARRNFVEGCVPVPSRCLTRLALMELPAAARERPRFSPLAADYVRRMFRTVGAPFDVRLCVRKVAAADLLTAATDFEVLDFHGPLPPGHSGKVELEVQRDGYFDGCLLWTVVSADAAHTVDYLQEQRAWLPVFVPMTETGIAVRRGDTVRISWRVFNDSDPRHPDYEFCVSLPAEGDRPVREFRQVTRHASTEAGATRLHRELLAGIGAEEQLVSVDALRAWLGDRLPEYMVPQSWNFLPELPLMPSGKLDREALPAPGRRRPRLAAAAIAPRNAIETAVAGLWAQALGLEAIGVKDNFFDLGGDSITAVQLTTATQRWLDAPLPLAALFDAPTVAAMCRHLESAWAVPLAAALGRGDAHVQYGALDREQGEL